MPCSSKAACCIAPDSEWATGWPMRTTRLVMLGPFRGRRRSRDRRSPRCRAGGRSSRPLRDEARRSRTSSRGDGRRGCRPRRRASGRAPSIARSSPSTSTSAPRAPSPAATPAIRSDSLWRSSPAPRIVVVPLGLRGREAQDRDLVDRRGDVSAGSTSIAAQLDELDPKVGDRLADVVAVRLRHRPVLLDLGAHRAQQVDDRPPRRVDADARGGSGRRPDGSRRRRARTRPRTRRPGRARRPPAPSTLPRSRSCAPPIGPGRRVRTVTPRARSIRSV